MKKIFTLVVVCICLFNFLSCSKEKSTNDDNAGITIESLSGTYALKALIWQSGSISADVYSQLDDCEKDNLIKLNTDKTVNYLDAGTVCSPPENDNGAWDLQGDSLYFTTTGNAAKIQSFDGKILILSGAPPNEPDIKATTTLEKQ
jgi:hypothetical protein